MNSCINGETARKLEQRVKENRDAAKEVMRRFQPLLNTFGSYITPINGKR